MRVIKFEHADEFCQRFSPLWLENEVASGVIYRVSKADKPGMHYYAVFDENGEMTLTACLNPSDQILLSGADPSATETLAAYLVDHGLDVPGIFAPKPLSLAFADSYEAMTGKAFKVVKALGHYGLSELKFTPHQADDVRLATLNEKQLLIEYRTASQMEGNTQRPVDPTETIVQEIEAQRLYILEWPDGQIVSTGSIQWDYLPESAYVDHIFTPVKHRGKGYATCLTFALSQSILSKNLIARLSVDLDNTPAIAVYEKLGYRRECEMNNLRQAPSL